ncbi:MAG: hypothetical protein JNM77_07275 [Pseudonocardia sp.]|nr:hypothetical protein [Pseudonocardia sp.]
MGYVERNASGRTELRVHGVAGTAPESVLQHPHTEQVAGNRDAGFFRRWWEARSVSADSSARRREAYSWGGLTSGDNLRALWLLLLPFMLLNVAFYMAPYRRPPEPDEPAGWRGWWSTPRRDRRRDRFSASVQRLLALSFTVTFTLTAITVAMDLVGWKCAAPSTGDVCGTSWLGWLDAARLRDRPGRQVAVTALVPLAAVGLLWWLAGATWDRLERVRPAASDTSVRPVDVETPLEDRAMWNGRGPVRRLRAVHVATGLALPGVFALAPLRADVTWRPTVLLAIVAFLAAMVVVVAHPAVARRERPSRDTGKDDDERRSPFRFLPWCALALTVLGLAVAATGTAAPAGPAEVRSTLPWLAGALQWTFVSQAVLLALLLAACRSLRRRARRAAAADPGEKRRVGLRPAWHGYAMPATALLAWVLAGGFSAGLVLRAADILGTPVAPGYRGDDAYPLVVPLAYRWVAATAFALAVTAVLSAVFVWVRLRRWRQVTTDVVQAYGAAATGADERRTEEIARAWARATLLTGEARRVLGFLLTVTAVVVLVAGVCFLFFRDGWVIDDRLVTAGNAVLSASVLGLLWVGRQAYRDPAKRRTVGIVWDLGTFWPRAVHPLAPPCYAERAVPDLIGRLEYLTGTGTDGAGTDDGTVLLSCHSQGSVLGAVVLMQVGTATSARTAFLTYGCPLARLYGRFFPAYFSGTALDRLGGFLRDADADADTDADADADADHRPAAAERATWRWRNLYRRSDPIGGAVFVDRPPVWSSARADPDDVDRPLLDPVFARPPGDPCSPPIRGHSNYFADPAFAWTADALQSGRLPRAVVRPPAGTSESAEARGTA